MGEAKIWHIKYSPEIYLKTCSSNFPSAWSASVLISFQGCYGSASAVTHYSIYVGAGGKWQSPVHTPVHSFVHSFLPSFSFRAPGVAYGSSQTKGQIRATVAYLQHSHSNTHSEPPLQPIQCQILNPLGRARDQTCILMNNSQVHFHWAAMGNPTLRFVLLAFLSFSFLSFLFFFYICTPGRWKFLGQGSNLRHSLHHSCGNAGSLGHCTARLGPGIKLATATDISWIINPLHHSGNYKMKTFVL